MNKSKTSGQSLKNLKDKFFQYYPLCEDQIKDLWTNSVFIFDTNVLFNLYRYSHETSQEFLLTISKLKERIWLPYRVAFEFHKNRMSVISDEINAYKEFGKNIEIIYDELENKNRNPYLSLGLKSQFSELKLKIKDEIGLKIKEYEDKYNNDGILKDIIDIFSINIGNEFSDEKLNSIFKEGELRYKEDIPPGFEDKKKPSPDRYGDLLIWHEIIEKSKEVKKPIIFITDDSKEDWWLIHYGKTISPRPELLKEFNNKTEQSCHFYKPFQFLNYSNTFLGSNINEEIIQEVKQLEKIKTAINRTVIIKMKVKCLGDKNDLNFFMNSISNDGYQISLENELKDGINSLMITLPDIDDLERRFTKKYLLALETFNIQLIDYTKHLIT